MTEQEIKNHIKKCKNCGTENYNVNNEFKCTKCGCVNKGDEADGNEII